MRTGWKFGRCWQVAGGAVLGLLGACAAPEAADDAAELGALQESLVDVEQSQVQRQSIGNCWIYSHASWIESMYLTDQGTELPLSQSYWTYWHWFDQITGSLSRRQGAVEISTGGNFGTANGIVRRYGLMAESAFVPEDVTPEISWRQYDALRRINASLSTGALSTPAARADRALVRAELDTAWELADGVVTALDTVFGTAVERRFDRTGSSRAVPGESGVLDPRAFPVSYKRRTVSRRSGERIDTVRTWLTTAMSEWRTASYWPEDRALLVRAQRALHARQPVILTWDVDFNAMDTSTGELRGSFNLQTLNARGVPGSQGGHMVVIEDYEAETVEYGRLLAGVTLDPALPEDAAKLTAALRSDTEIRFFRVKNSWGTSRPDRSSAPGFPGYHDLYMDYLNGPIAWCPSADRSAPDFACTGTTVPLSHFILPPGF
jgi:hypothetical protein